MRLSTGIATVALGAAMVTIPVAAATAAEPVIWEAQASSCSLSYLPTTADGTAYFILEAGSDASCRLQVGSGATQSVIADVTTVNTMAVVYIGAAGDYTYDLSDLTDSSTASGVVSFTGEPTEPDLGSRAIVSDGCALDLQNRDVIGTFGSWQTGFTVSQNQGASNCSHDVASDPVSPTAYTASIARNLGQIAVLSPFAIDLDKRVTGPGGEGAGQVRAGDVLTYTFTVTNTGYVPWQFTITDMLEGLRPITCDSDVVAARSTMVCTAEYIVTDADADAGVVTNVASVTGIDSVRPQGATDVRVTTDPVSVSLPVSPRTSTPTPTPTPVPSRSAVPTPSPSATPGQVTVTDRMPDATPSRHPAPADALASTGSSSPPALLWASTALVIAGIGMLALRAFAHRRSTRPRE